MAAGAVPVKAWNGVIKTTQQCTLFSVTVGERGRPKDQWYGSPQVAAHGNTQDGGNVNSDINHDVTHPLVTAQDTTDSPDPTRQDQRRCIVYAIIALNQKEGGETTRGEECGEGGGSVLLESTIGAPAVRGSL